MSDYPMRWRVRKTGKAMPLQPGRFGQPCRVLARSRRMNMALVEFADGHRVITSRWYVRRAPTPPRAEAP